MATLEGLDPATSGNLAGPPPSSGGGPSNDDISQTNALSIRPQGHYCKMKNNGDPGRTRTCNLWYDSSRGTVAI